MDRFAFIIHPVEIEQLYRFHPTIRWIPKSQARRILKWFPSFEVARMSNICSNTGKKIEGHLIGFPLLPKQILKLDERFVIKKIVAAGNIARDLGAKIVGLGAYTSVVGDQGVVLANEIDIAVTTGNSYTVATIIEGCLKTAALKNIQLPQAKAAVIGATGSIGSACTQILAQYVCQLIITAQNREKLEELACQIHKNYQTSVEIEDDPKKAVSDAEIVIATSSAPRALIDIGDLKEGAIACDAAIPRNIATRGLHNRRDVLIFKGGLTKMPEKVSFDVDIGLPPGVVYACMAETMTLAFEGRFEDYSIGRSLSLSKIEEIKSLASKHGFTLFGINEANQTSKKH